MPKFKSGEIAIIVKSTQYPEAIGRECMIVLYDDEDCDYAIEVEGFPHPEASEGVYYWAYESDLKKLPPKDDLTTWDNCIFKPEGVKV